MFCFYLCLVLKHYVPLKHVQRPQTQFDTSEINEVNVARVFSFQMKNTTHGFTRTVQVCSYIYAVKMHAYFMKTQFTCSSL